MIVGRYLIGPFMKKLLLAILLSACALAAGAQTTDNTIKKEVGAFIDEWHDDAAHARWAYFDKMAKDGVYIGTDKTELWHRDEFKAWAKRFFERGKAWSFKAIKRNIYLSDDKKFIWFDEQLDTQMGVCQASGVIRKTDQGYLIEHYQLSMAIPNEINDQVVRAIRDMPAAAPAK